MVYYFEQEVGWIAANLANSTPDVVNNLFYDYFTTDAAAVTANSSQAQRLPSQEVLQWLRRALTSPMRASKLTGLWLTSNAIAENKDVAILLTTGLGGLSLYQVFNELMDTRGEVKLSDICLIMWNLCNLMR